MESKRNAPASDTFSGGMPKRAARHPASPSAQDPKWPVARTLRRHKVFIVDYDEETFARFQALLASFGPPKANP